MTKRVFLLFQVALLPVAPFAAYVIGLVLGLNAGEAIRAVTVALPPLIVVAGMVQPLLVIDRLVTRALAPGEGRLMRILELPQRIVLFGWMLEWVVGVSGFCLACIVWFDKPASAAPAGLMVGMSLAALIGVPLVLKLEELFLPAALEEAARTGPVRDAAFSVLRPRQKWFLPYAFGVFLVATFVVNGAIEAFRGSATREELAAQLAAAGDAAGAALVRAHDDVGFGARAGQFAGTLDLLAISCVAAWMLARRQERATHAVRVALESMAQGRAKQPEWVSTDELGDLAAEMGTILDSMRELPGRLQGSAKALAAAGLELKSANDAQGEAVARQMAALAQSRVTAEELRLTSQHAASRAQTVIRVAERAEVLGKTGETAIGASLAGLNEIRRVVEEIRTSMARLDARTAAIGGIAQTVKDLADQSNMLALNAAIEAVRSGEHGRSFAVVAREIRNLADQSLQSTRQIRENLDALRDAIGDAVRMSSDGAERVRTGLEQLRGSGANLQELSAIVRDSSAAVREIAASVSQQNAGVSQLFAIFEDLSASAASVSARLSATTDAHRTLQEVSGEVREVARRFDAA